MEERVLFTQDMRCRLCLKNSDIMENLFSSDSTYKDTLKKLIGIKFELDVNLPSSICTSCIEIIKTFLEFKETCIKSQEILSKEHNLLKVETINYTKKSDNDNHNEYIVKIKIENEALIEKNISEYPEEDTKVSINNSSKQSKKSRNAKKVHKLDFQDLDKSLKNTNKKSKFEKCSKKEQNKKSEKSKDQTNTKNESIWRKYARSYDTPCYICGKLYRKSKLQYHINGHLDRRPFVCKVENCDKAFASPIHLRQHNLLCHSADTPHKCEICERGFKTPAALRFHKTYHFDPQLPCELCGKLLRNPKTLRTHLFSHTGERPYKCDECDKSFKMLSALKVHLRIHTKEKPFLCTVCDKSFTYSQMLKQHVEKNHPGSVVSYAQHRPEIEENVK